MNGDLFELEQQAAPVTPILSAEGVQLRDYQLSGVESARALIREGKRSVLINAPTGAGKTALASHMVAESVRKGRRCTFVIDRLSLLDQTSAVFDGYGIDHGIIQGDHWRWAPSKQVQIASVQTLSRREWPASDLVIVDEAHVVHEVVRKYIKERRSLVLGLTATPFTKGLGKVYDGVVNVCTTDWLIEQGWLVPFTIFCGEEPDMSGVTVKSSGEWDEKESSKRALQVVGDVVQEYLDKAAGRKFICSAVDTTHVEELARQFIAAGIPVATYTYRDHVDDRRETVDEFRKPDSAIRGLITVTAASRGFDVPDVSCVISARPLRKSLAEFIQLLGRGFRTSLATGKVDCIVLDHGGNSSRFWHPMMQFFAQGWDELDDGTKKPKAAPPERDREPKKCPQCGHLHRPARVCPVCGHEYPRELTVQHVPGTLKELIATGNQQMLRAKLWPQVCHWVLDKTDDMERAQKRAQAIYMRLTGEFAKARIQTTDPVPPTPELRKKLLADQIRWAKGRAAGERRAA